jgi:hypothetical protein
MNASNATALETSPFAAEMRIEAAWVDVVPMSAQRGANDAASEPQRLRSVDVLAMVMADSGCGF